MGNNMQILYVLFGWKISIRMNMKLFVTYYKHKYMSVYPFVYAISQIINLHRTSQSVYNLFLCRLLGSSSGCNSSICCSWLLRWGVRNSQEFISDMCALSKTTKESTVYSSRIIPDSMFACKEKPTFHILSRCGGWRHWCRQHIIVAPRGSHSHKRIRTTGPWISSPSSHYSLFRLWHGCIAKYTLQNSNTATHYDIITDILHDGSSFSCHQCKKNWCTVQVPKQK
jgi:hypothetical protein